MNNALDALFENDKSGGCPVCHAPFTILGYWGTAYNHMLTHAAQLAAAWSEQERARGRALRAAREGDR